MIKRSRRALVIAASFALGLSAVGPAAHAGLLGGDSDNAVEGADLPVGGDLLGGNLLGGVLGGDGLLGGVLGGDGLLGGVLGGDGLPLVGDVLGGEGGPLGAVGGILGGEGGPLGAVGGVLGGGDGALATEGLAGTLEVLPLGILGQLSGGDSMLPGLDVLGESGVLGILGSL